MTHKKIVFSLVVLMLISLLASCADTTQDEISGSWSISGIALLGSSDVGSVDMSFSVDEDGQRKSENILFFDSSGDFRSDCKLISVQLYAGESLNLTAYDGWKFIKESENEDTISGKIEFTPVTGDFSYALSLSRDSVMTLTVTEVYHVESASVEGYMTKGGEIPMTYTLTLIRTPE